MGSALQDLQNRCHISCRTCVGECLLLQQLGVNGLGLAELKTASAEALTPFYCTACDLCAVVCNRRLNPGEALRAWRGEIADTQGIPAGLRPRLTDQPDDVFTLFRREYGDGGNHPEPATAETVFFPGCALSAYRPELALAVFDSLQKRFPGLGWLEACCNDLLDSLGLEERYARAQQPLRAELERGGVKRLVTACPTCHYQLVQAFPDLQVISIYQLLADERHKISGLAGKIAVHDSCPDRTKQVIGGAVRSLLPETAHLKHEGKRSLCCGAGDGVSFTNPVLSQEIAGRHWAEIEASGAELLVTYCTTCTIQLAQTSPGIPVAHILDLVFGLEPDYGEIAARIGSLCRDLQEGAEQEDHRSMHH